MADFLRCANKTAHEQHGWTEVDGKVVSVVDASTVLQGAKYHVCSGVRDLTEESKHLRRRESVPYGHSRPVEVSATDHKSDLIFPGPVRDIRERRIELDAVYERTVIETPWVKVQQLTCWCCTCDEGIDWACRNHNMGWGMRPCDVHGVEGQREVNPETDEEGEMPDSVLVYRAKQRAVDLG